MLEAEMKEAVAAMIEAVAVTAKTVVAVMAKTEVVTETAAAAAVMTGNAGS
jgi:hypothetical protein